MINSVNATISILGTEYSITTRPYDSNPEFKRMGCGAYVTVYEHHIYMCDMHTYPGYQNDTEEQITASFCKLLRHEIVHAFLEESGLGCNSSETDCWARNEEMVDWIALQGPKFYKVWEQLDII